MQGIELRAYGITGWERRDFAGCNSQYIHAGDDHKLGDHGERQHEDHDHMAQREGPRSSHRQAVVNQGTSQENDSGNDADPVQIDQRTAYNEPRQMGCRQHSERCLGHDGEEDQSAKPCGQGKQHEKAHEGHVENSRPELQIEKQVPFDSAQGEISTLNQFGMTDGIRIGVKSEIYNHQSEISYTGTGTESTIS